MPRVGGGTFRLSELRGNPALLHFGSFTRPVTMGSVEPMEKLHALWGENVQFVEESANAGAERTGTDYHE